MSNIKNLKLVKSALTEASLVLPKKYQWLLKQDGTKMIDEGLKEYGIIETPGSNSNKTILAWAKEVGKDTSWYTNDAIPWCGLYMAVIATRAEKDVPKSPLAALSWASFGVRSQTPMYGDVLVFVRKGGGHVGLYVAESDNTFHILAGNQSDKVTITEIAKSRLYTSRRPIYKIAQPDSVKRIYIDSSGVVSGNEQ